MDGMKVHWKDHISAFSKKSLIKESYHPLLIRACLYHRK